MQLFRPTNLWDGFAACDFSNTGYDKGRVCFWLSSVSSVIRGWTGIQGFSGSSGDCLACLWGSCFFQRQQVYSKSLLTKSSDFLCYCHSLSPAEKPLSRLHGCFCQVLQEEQHWIPATSTTPTCQRSPLCRETYLDVSVSPACLSLPTYQPTNLLTCSASCLL